MNYNQKQEFLEYAKELARNLEEKTDEYIEIQIGWIDGGIAGSINVTIVLNNPDGWFGSFEPYCWNEQVIWNNINNFVPVLDPYLALNELIDKVYRSR